MDVRLTPSLRAELEAFFVEVVRFGKKQVEIKGWAGAGAARKLIQHSVVGGAKQRRSRDGAPRRGGRSSG